MSEEVQIVERPSKVPGVKKTMVWTEEHDTLLSREIIALEVFSTKKGTSQRSAKWGQVAIQLSGISRPHFKVDKRSVRDRYNLLADRLRMKLKREQKESGIATQMSDCESALELIIENEDASDQFQQENSDKNKEKAATDRKNAEEVRKRAMETLAKTQKRKSGEEGGPKKRRSNGSDAIVFLKEKNEQQLSLARDKLELKKKQIEAEGKRHEDLISLMQRQQQVQMENFQRIMSQQQQQNTQLVMKLLEKVAK